MTWKLLLTDVITWFIVWAVVSFIICLVTDWMIPDFEGLGTIDDDD